MFINKSSYYMLNSLRNVFLIYIYINLFGGLFYLPGKAEGGIMVTKNKILIQNLQFQVKKHMIGPST